jgi:hypothetical protein
MHWRTGALAHWSAVTRSGRAIAAHGKQSEILSGFNYPKFADTFREINGLLSQRSLCGPVLRINVRK